MKAFRLAQVKDGKVKSMEVKMGKLMIGVTLAVTASVMGGCVCTRQISEVTVHKDPNGKVISVDYTERLEQQDAKPWQPFGGYLKEYGPDHK